MCWYFCQTLFVKYCIYFYQETIKYLKLTKKREKDNNVKETNKYKLNLILRNKTSRSMNNYCSFYLLKRLWRSENIICETFPKICHTFRHSGNVFGLLFCTSYFLTQFQAVSNSKNYYLGSNPNCLIRLMNERIYCIWLYSITDIGIIQKTLRTTKKKKIKRKIFI